MWCADYGLRVDLCVTMCMFIKCGESGGCRGKQSWLVAAGGQGWEAAGRAAAGLHRRCGGRQAAISG